MRTGFVGRSHRDDQMLAVYDSHVSITIEIYQQGGKGIYQKNFQVTTVATIKV